jgi:hypothetical protein
MPPLVASMTPDGIAIVKAIERLSDEVRGVRIAVESFGMPTGESEPVTICTHPSEARANFSSQGVEEWQCKVCGFHFTAPLAAAGV